MHGFDLIATLAGGLTAGLVFGYITHRLGLSPIAGYLLGGVLVGPHSPGFIADASLAEQLAEVGVILLMFGVGLQFHIQELLAVRRVAIPGAVGQSLAAASLGAVVAHAFGWEWAGATVFGMALAVASTVVLIRVLADNRALHSPIGHIAVGWLVVEDLFTVIVLVVLPVLFGPDAGSTALLSALALTAVKVVVLVAVILIGGGRLLPRLLDHAAATHSRELFTLTVLVIVLGIAVVSAVLFGVSMALGAFLAGLVVGRSEYSLRAASDALPMRDAFAVLFFVSVGMLLDPGFLLESPGLILAMLAVVVIAKPLVAILIVRLLRYPLHVALGVGVALAQIGEFSFILVALGRELGVLTPTAMNAAVTVAIISIVINPIFYRLVTLLERRATTSPRLWRVLHGSKGDPDVAGGEEPRELSPSHRNVVVGYGPTGQTLTRLLRENDIEPTVIELNVDTVRQLRADGIQAIYGDARQRDTLTAAGIEKAGSLILTTDIEGSEQVIKVARELNPKIHVLARAAHLRQAKAYRAAGARTVFSGEGEVALALTEAVLHRLGATPDQIDRERDRVHSELFQ